VGTTAAIVTFVLSDSNLPHYVCVLALLLDTLFLWMESRRFRSYEMIRTRVRLLEQGFYVAALGGEPLENWHQALIESLRKPAQAVTYLQAFSVRVRRNYLWLIAVVHLAWLVKVDLGGPFPDVAVVGPIPGKWVVAASFAILIPFVALSAIYRAPEEG
jgi:uncharacterized membrane protein